jgi:hypothetical protein
MFKLKIIGNPESRINKLRKRANDMPFIYRVWIYYHVRRINIEVKKYVK